MRGVPVPVRKQFSHLKCTGITDRDRNEKPNVLVYFSGRAWPDGRPVTTHLRRHVVAIHRL